MRLVGYINRSRTFPAPLICVYRGGDGYIAVYPSGDRIKLADVASDTELTSRDSFVQPSLCPRLPIGASAYAVSPVLVIGGARNELKRRLRELLAKRASSMEEEQKDRIEEFLGGAVGMLDTFVGAMNAERLREWVEESNRVIVSLQKRRLRRSQHWALTLLVQSAVAPGLTRTLYRKSIPRGKRLRDVSIPSSTVSFLINRVAQAA